MGITFSVQSFIALQTDPSDCTQKGNGNLSLAENVSSPEDLQSQECNLQEPIRKGTCRRRRKFSPLQFLCMEVSRYCDICFSFL